ncbi:cytochrome-c peroxidase [Pseudoalteromonas aurantia]|uniref:cytochrome-c peroxidase n=1 Tax=Pseudoalteromonas aurantia TaxID=43654 RepID=UPI0020162213|nr:cytochrome-c peroxidase [Pseudoalteromonas aurantia]
MSKQPCLLSAFTALTVFVCSVAVALPSPQNKRPPAKPPQIANQLDSELRALIAQFELTGHISGQDTAPTIHDPIPQLGMQLFFSKALGVEKCVACASCHHPKLGGGDSLSLPIGVNAVDADKVGLSRQAMNDEIDIPRNSPTIFNVGLATQALFWDGG